MDEWTTNGFFSASSDEEIMEIVHAIRQSRRFWHTNHKHLHQIRTDRACSEERSETKKKSEV